MKFIHLADIHLGAEPESQLPIGKIRKQEIWDAFTDVINHCEEEKFDLLLIAGDLFHGQPLLRDVKEVDYLFRKLTKTKVVLIAGNHDCLLPTSHYYDVTFPEHVVFLMDSHADSVYFPDLRTQVYGLSYEKKQIPEPRYDSIQIEDAGRINILLAHGNINCTDKSIPIHREAIEAAGFDYAALGHLHTAGVITDRIAYTGAFEPLERNEVGQRGYIEGTLQKNSLQKAEITTRFIPHAKREYIKLSIEVTPAMTQREIGDRILSEQNRIGMQHMYDITLSGHRARELELELSEYRKQGIVVEVTDETIPDFDIEDLANKNKDNLIGRFIEETEEIPEEELRQKVLQYGLRALLIQK